jgi:hypothetical protein
MTAPEALLQRATGTIQVLRAQNSALAELKLRLEGERTELRERVVALQMAVLRGAEGLAEAAAGHQETRVHLVAQERACAAEIHALTERLTAAHSALQALQNQTQAAETCAVRAEVAAANQTQTIALLQANIEQLQAQLQAFQAHHEALRLFQRHTAIGKMRVWVRLYVDDDPNPRRITGLKTFAHQAELLRDVIHTAEEGNLPRDMAVLRDLAAEAERVEALFLPHVSDQKDWLYATETGNVLLQFSWVCGLVGRPVPERIRELIAARKPTVRGFFSVVEAVGIMRLVHPGASRQVSAMVRAFKEAHLQAWFERARPHSDRLRLLLSL